MRWLRARKFSDAACEKQRERPDNGMHPTRDTNDFMLLRGLGGLVMPGVRRLPESGH
jgi:hypothetical protein